MKCPNCSSEVPEGKQFCGYCGERLVMEFEDDAQTKFVEPMAESPSEKVICQSCGAVLPEDSRFCNICGIPLEVLQVEETCPTCGTPIPAGSYFCNSCGANLSSEAKQTPIPVSASSSEITPREIERPHLAKVRSSSQRKLPASIKALPWLFMFSVLLAIFSFPIDNFPLWLFYITLIISFIPTLIGLWKLKKWAWWLSIIEACLLEPILILFLPNFPDFFAILLLLALLTTVFYLLRRDVRRAFGIGSGT